MPKISTMVSWLGSEASLVARAGKNRERPRLGLMQKKAQQTRSKASRTRPDRQHGGPGLCLQSPG